MTSKEDKKITTPRCILLFEGAIRSEKTLELYRQHLKNFLKWNELENYDDLLKADDKSIQNKLMDYLLYLKKNFSPNYVPTIFKGIELFFIMNEVNINSKLLHKMFPEQVKKGGYGAYTRDMIETMLSNTIKNRTKSLILLLASSGIRVGVIPDLKLKDVTNYEDCKKILCYAGSKEEYIAFMTPEASKSFDEYLEERQNDGERLTPESPAFRKTYALGSVPAEKMTIETIRSSIAKSMKNVQKTKTGNRFNIPTVHGFRKYFNIVLKSRDNANISLAEKLMGHSVTVSLDNAYAPFDIEKVYEEYKKSIPELTISSEERQRLELEIKDIEIKELERVKNENIGLLERVESLEKNYHEPHEEREEQFKIMKRDILKQLADDDNIVELFKEFQKIQKLKDED